MEAIEKYAKEIQEAINKDYAKNVPNVLVPVTEVVYGKRYAKLCDKLVVNGKIISNSVHCFVDIATGDIYKAASWSTPAKGVRGNIHKDKKPLLGYDFYNKY